MSRGLGDVYKRQDIKFACDNGMTGVLVLSGEATEEDYLSSGLKAIVKRSIAEWDR